MNFNVDYTFQYRYRSKSLSFYFNKELLCAMILLIVFQLINYDYLNLFKGNPLFLTASTNSTTGQVTVSIIPADLTIYDFGSVTFVDSNLTQPQLTAEMATNKVIFG